MLSVKYLTKNFDGLVAVKELSFDIREGEILAIIGPNGAGKSTVFNLMTGTLAPTSGKVFIHEENITGLKPYQIVKKGVARTFQTTSLFDQLRVIDNMLIAYKWRTRLGFWNTLFHTPAWKSQHDQAARNALETLDFLGLADKALAFIPTLSQEEQKRLAIGIALVCKPKLLLLDEPTGGLIQEETERIALFIKKVRDQGTTVCIIEHKMQMIMGMADRIVVLNYGQKIAEGTPDEIKTNQAVIEAYLGGDVHA
ncbi:ABC transporter ATP-binding protein [Desulfatitalea alkaliphila]|uniref:ABC transporter ATP-binding protein n=1 Tax=Desulfatitalea alkaliphila TaxID=2929485 RepID=A0AA41R0X7_9BACT|nr:ABC transporter ATP-binding protein [Desulfatitalea alkaliphila]MCJ8500269.1 ABC transporter ATP-binding protein [Desulfatitalea alkaliphila]